MKVNPETVAKAMKGTLQNEVNDRTFQLFDFFTPQQVASYLSRMSNLQKTMSPCNDE